MVIFAFMFMALASRGPDPLAMAMDNYSRVESYTVTLRSRSSSGREVIRYFYKRPGFVRMEFIKPHRGAVLVYNPIKREARLRPFSFMKFFVLLLSPESRLIRSKKGHSVDRSDIGAFLENARRVQENGHLDVEGTEHLNGRDVVKVRIRGRAGFSSLGVNTYVIRFDAATYMPLRVKAFGPGGEPVEEVDMEDLHTGVELPDKIFTLE